MHAELRRALHGLLAGEKAETLAHVMQMLLDKRSVPEEGKMKPI